MMQGLDASFDAVLLVSYHGSMATSSTLSHTYNPRAIAEVRLNGDGRRASPASTRSSRRRTASRSCS